jgi:hypothetical protein
MRSTLSKTEINEMIKYGIQKRMARHNRPLRLLLTLNVIATILLMVYNAIVVWSKLDLLNMTVQTLWNLR